MSDQHGTVRLAQLPPVEEDELLSGYLYRCAIVGGWPRIKDLIDDVAERQTIEGPWTLPANLNKLCDVLRPVFASPLDMLDRHTCLPAHLVCATPDKVQDIKDHALKGTRYPGLGASIGLAAKAIITKPRLMFCVECAKADTERHGFAFWRRSHQLGGFGYCHRHCTPLTFGCGHCRMSQATSRAARLPEMMCWCGQELDVQTNRMSHEDRRVIIRMARYGVRLLNHEMTSWGAGELGVYFREKAAAAGYAAGNYIKSAELAAAIGKQYSVAVLARANALPINTQKGGWVAAAMRKRLAPCAIGRTLLLLDFFKGRVPDADDLARVKGVAVVRRGGLEPSGSALSLDKHTVESDRRHVELLLSIVPNATRTYMQSILGKVIQRVLYRDRDWYHSKIHSVKKDFAAPSDDDKALVTADFDERTSRHVRERAKILLASATEKPVKLTKKALLQGTPRGNMLTEERLRSMPSTRVALRECVETRMQYLERCARIILTRSAPLDELFKVAISATGLNLQQLEAINLRIRAEGFKRAS